MYIHTSLIFSIRTIRSIQTLSDHAFFLFVDNFCTRIYNGTNSLTLDPRTDSPLLSSFDDEIT